MIQALRQPGLALAAFGLLAAATAAQADPLQWTVDPVHTTLSITASALGGFLQGSGSASASGTQASDFDALTSIEALAGGAIVAGPITLTGGIAGNATGVTVDLVGGPAAIAGGSANLAGFVLNVPAGIVTVTSPTAATVDLSSLAEPLSFTLGSTVSSFSLFGSTTNPDSTVSSFYSWAIPINVSTTIQSGLPVPITLAFGGQITLLSTVTTPVPEPASFGLMALGLVAVGAALRRRG